MLAAGVFSREEGKERIREYAVTLLREFFRRKGNSLQIPDGGLALREVFQHLDRGIRERGGVGEANLSAVLALARPDKVFLARCGETQALLHREGETTPAFASKGEPLRPLGCGEGVEVEMVDLELQPGDVLVLEDPSLASLVRPRDLTVILQRAGDLHRAGVFLAAVAERKGAEGPFTALMWEVPNLRRDATFFDESSGDEPSPKDQEGEPRDFEGDDEEEGTVEQVKRRWLDRFRRRRE